MFERQEIWYRRFILKQPPPWTANKILAENKFTNVYRELDRASQWLIKNVLIPSPTTFEDLIFKIICYRFYNLPNAFECEDQYRIALPGYHDFKAKVLWQQTVDYREHVGDPWSNAYFKNPRLAKPAGWNRRGIFRDETYCEYIIPAVHKLIPVICQAIRQTKPTFESCEQLIVVLTQIPGVAKFMAHEFFQDFCYINIYSKQFKVNLNRDCWTHCGPGCATGIRLIFPSLEPKEQIQGLYWLRDLSKNQLEKIGDFKYLHWNKAEEEYYVDNNWNIHLSEIEMWCCELQKYWKVKIGMGKQRSKFKPRTIVN
jgi:hypothetical protein